MSSRHPALFIGTALAAIAADQLTKLAARVWLTYAEPLWLVRPYLALTHVRNPGAAFSLLPGRTVVFIVVAVAVVAGAMAYWWLARPASRWVVAGLGLIVGGGVGNLIDRATTGLVTDFIDFRVFPIFNVADSCIVVGTTILVIVLLLGGERERAVTAADPASDAPAGPEASNGAS